MRKRKRQTAVAALAWGADALLWLSAGSAYVPPARLPLLAAAGLAFPFCLAAVLFMLAVTLAVARRHAWVPLLGLLLAGGALRAYCPVNLSAPEAEDGIVVMTYNTEAFAHNRYDADGNNAVAAYIARQKADIVCLQEATPCPIDLYDKETAPLLGRTYAHTDTVHIAANVLACLSRWPVVEHGLICSNGNNGAAYFKVVPPDGDTVIVVNCHLESMHLSHEERREYHDIVTHKRPGADGQSAAGDTLRDNSLEDSSRRLLGKVSAAAVARAAQADAVAGFVRANARRPLILCGDFNDTPVSYTRRRIARAGLTDAYEARGTGIGRSFYRDAIYVRIDHIFCSGHFRPVSCHTDPGFTVADHCPVFAVLARRPAP